MSSTPFASLENAISFMPFPTQSHLATPPPAVVVIVIIIIIIVAISFVV
jgi:hypothetical protein